MRSMRFSLPPLAALVITLALCPSARSQTFTTVVNLNGTDGEYASALAQATDGNYYGAVSVGGTNNGGAIFQFTAGGNLTDTYSFCSLPNCADGYDPTAAPILGSDGILYGTTSAGGVANGGGASQAGTVFKMTLGGKLANLYSFCPKSGCFDGSGPVGLVQASNSNFYGATASGGKFGEGTLFELTSTGGFKLMYTFCSRENCADGSLPRSAPMQASNGNFYGTTQLGGSHNDGVVYEITPTGSYKVLYNFCAQVNCSDGQYPMSAVVQDSAGNLFGTAFYGGAYGDGVVYEITPKNQYVVLYSFNGIDGGSSYAALTLANDGNLYGTSVISNNNWNEGNIFKVTPQGEYTSLYSFCNYGTCTGYAPMTTLLEATNGTLYGATTYGGAYNYGTVFSLNNSLSPLVETVPMRGKVGTRVIILGNNLTGSTSVTFNGTEAAFTVESDTYITATVPTGAITGTISVTTPTGALNSNPVFQVLN